MEIVITIKRNLTSEMLGDIMCTCLESGYSEDWFPDYESEIKDGVYLSAIVYEDEDDNGDPDSYKKHELNGEKIIAAIKRIADENMVRQDLRESILNAVIEGDMGHIDAEGADVIVQIALLGEVKYG